MIRSVKPQYDETAGLRLDKESQVFSRAGPSTGYIEKSLLIGEH
jgi:hypothetical protein